MVINVPLNSSVAANLIFASRFVLNINYHQCPLIFSLILASRKVFILSKPCIKILWILNILPNGVPHLNILSTNNKKHNILHVAILRKRT